jgi:hypothetical protein
MRYAELQITTNFSFLRGASHADELAAQAKALGLEAIAVTDRNTFAGLVRAHVAAKEAGLRFIPGVRLDLEDGPSLLAYPTGRQAYGRLSRLISLGQGRAEKGKCSLSLADVAAHAEGQIFIALPADGWDWREAARWPPLSETPPATAKIIAFRDQQRSPRGKTEHAPYFLTVHDIVRFARGARGILCQGRGSAANSAVCYVPRHHRGRSRPQRPAVRALRSRSARAARHRRRFRARAARGGHPVGLRDLRPRPAPRSVLDRHPLSHQGRRARCRQGARPARGSDQALSSQVWGWRGVDEKRAREAQSQSGAIRACAWRSSWRRSSIGTPRHLSQHPAASS